jgi:hypothetical protein
MLKNKKMHVCCVKNDGLPTVTSSSAMLERSSVVDRVCSPGSLSLVTPATLLRTCMFLHRNATLLASMYSWLPRLPVHERSLRW